MNPEPVRVVLARLPLATRLALVRAGLTAPEALARRGRIARHFAFRFVDRLRMLGGK